MKYFYLLTLFALIAANTSNGCTIFFVSDNENTFAANNEDWRNPRTVAWFVPAKGNEYGAVFFGFKRTLGIAQGGMNEKGLFLDWAALPHVLPERTDKYKRYIGDITRKILHNCASIDDVINLLNKYPGTITYGHTLIADSTGKSVILESSEKGYHVIRNNQNFNVITNFHLEHKEYGNYPCDRYNMVQNMYAKNNEASIENVKNILEAVHSDGEYGTKYSNIYDLKNKKIYVYHNQNYENVVVFNLLDELKKGKHTYYLPDLFKTRKVDYKKLTIKNNIAYFGNEDFPYSGQAIDYYNNGNKKLIAIFYKGLPNETWTYLDTEGKVISKDNYKQEYNRNINGHFESILNYKNNQLHGKCNYFYPNGNIALVENFDEGKPIDSLKAYNENGEITFSGYYNKQILYSDKDQSAYSGKIILSQSTEIAFKERAYNNGLLQHEIAWFNNGQKDYEFTYNNNSKQGVWKWWYETGEIKREKNYSNDKLNGEWKFWNKNGQLIFIAEYKDDIRLSEKRWNSKGKRVRL